MANLQLTAGAIERIMTGEQVDGPILQVLGQKRIAGNTGSGGADRYRLLLSDGVNSHSSAMLATQLNDKVDSGELSQFAVINLVKFLCNQIQPDRRVVIVLDMQVLERGEDVGSKIGSPVQYKPGQAPVQPVEPAPVAPMQNAMKENKQPAAAHSSPATNQGKSFYGNPPAAPRTPVQNKNTGISPNLPLTPGGTPARVHPISSLTPYQNRWTIRARVTNKGGIRTWSNSRGEGKLFSINLVDESGEIRATLFKEQVDKYFDMIEVNKVYYISKATLKTANKQYSNVDNDYEMTFNNDTQIIACTEECDLPSLTFKFVGIAQLESKQPQDIIDIVGVVKQTLECATIVGKASGKEVKKRDIVLVDESKVQVRLTIWGNEAENFDGSGCPVMAIKGAKVSDWGGRSLSAMGGSQSLLNPDIPEAHRLRGWYDNVGHSLDFNEYKSDGAASSGGYSTNWKTFSEAKQDIPAGDKANYYTTKGTIVFMKKENCMYMACPSADCNKKVVDQSNGLYRCEKCNKEYPNYKYRMILSTNLADFTDNQWATCFQETAEAVLGKPADEIGQLKENNEAAFDQMFQEATFRSFIFKLRSKMETYNDESRMKTVCVSATPLDFKEYNKHLIEDIEKMLQS